MNIDYYIIDNGKQARLIVSGFSPLLMDKLKSCDPPSLIYEVEGYTLSVHYSGINRLEANYGAITIYVSDNWTEQMTTISGYVSEDRNIFYQRVNDIMELVNSEES